jgi:DNA invertase Pin-like site-specific DNA recombinase
MENPPRTRRRRLTINRDAPLAAYARVSSERQADSGISIAGQRSTIAEYARRHGLEVGSWHADEGVSGSKRADRRPGLRTALEAIRSGQASGVICAKVDRLGRSVEVLQLAEEANREGWTMVLVDIGLDSTSTGGEAVLYGLAMAARIEARRASERMRDFHSERRRQGLRRKDATPPEIADRMLELRDQGAPFASIASTLNSEGITTARGSRWYEASVQRVVNARRRERDAQAAA